jgi:hypothetical protein
MTATSTLADKGIAVFETELNSWSNTTGVLLPACHRSASLKSSVAISLSSVSAPTV